MSAHVCIEVVQALLLAAILSVLLRRRDRREVILPPVAMTAAPSAKEEKATVDLLVRGEGDEWVLHSTRPAGHRDVEEAIVTPGMAVRGVDGVIREGVQ